MSVNNTTTPATVTLSAPVIGKGVKSGDTITFGTNNQCNELITAAQNAAKAGTWVYSIAYGSGLTDSQADTVANNSDFSSCSDTETPPVNSCYTMSKLLLYRSKFDKVLLRPYGGGREPEGVVILRLS